MDRANYFNVRSVLGINYGQIIFSESIVVAVTKRYLQLITEPWMVIGVYIPKMVMGIKKLQGLALSFFWMSDAVVPLFEAFIYVVYVIKIIAAGSDIYRLFRGPVFVNC